MTQTFLKEAADWFARLQDAEPGARAEFDAWLLRSPAHIEAYLRVSQTWGDIGLVDGLSTDDLVAIANTEPSPDNVVAMSKSPLPLWERERDRVRGSSWRIPVSIAAALLLLACAWLFARPQPVRTAIGEQRSVLLEDGSVAYLNTNSELKVRYAENERRLDLLHGEARFTVAKNPRRPFVVVTPQARVRALGTVFNVQASPEQTAVTVIEGAVAVSGVKLQRGQHAAVTPQGIVVPNAGPSVERVLGWPQRQLVFREEMLADVVAEFNRYHTHAIRVAEPQLASMRISAVFDSNDPGSLIQYLEKYRDVRAQPSGAGAVTLSQRK